MHRHALRFLGPVLVLTTLLAGTGGAAPLVDQPYLDNGDNGPFSEFGHQEIADQFTLPAGTAMGRVEWYGVALSGDAYSNPNQTVAFHIRFFADDGGVPGATSFTDLSVAALPVDTGLRASDGDRPVYRFGADVAVTVGGAQQWISILESDPATPPGTFRWVNGTGPSGSSSAVRQTDGAAWDAVTTERTNLAFSLLPPTCGDGIVDTGEQCDAGVANGTAGSCCAADCTFTTGASDDGNACTTGDACSAGACVGGPPPDCSDTDPCTDDQCAPATGCVHEKTVTAFGDDDSGCLPPDATTAQCENAVAQAAGTLMGGILGCHAKAAVAGVKGSSPDDELCESNPANGRGVLERFFSSVDKLVPKCGDDCFTDNAATLAAQVRSFLDARNGDVYCAPGAPFPSDDTGSVPPDQASAICESGVAKAAGKYAAAVLKCHQKTASAAAKGVVLDDDRCESDPVSGRGARQKFEAMITKLATRCTGCAIANAPDVRETVEEFIETHNALVYCVR